VFTTMG